MNKKEHEKINPDCCSTCIHNSVCCYKQDFLDICKTVEESTVTKQLGSQGMRSKKVTLYDILGEIIIKCKHYYDGSRIRIDSDGFTVQFNPPAETTATDPRLWSSTYTTAHN